MNIVELVVMVCSLLNPNACSEKHFAFEFERFLEKLHDAGAAVPGAVGRRPPE